MAAPVGGGPADGVPLVALMATSPTNAQAMSASGSRRCQAVTGPGSSVVRWLACSHHDDARARSVRARASGPFGQPRRWARTARTRR